MIRQKLKYASTLAEAAGDRYEVALGTIRFLLAFTSLLLPDLRINGTNRVKNTLLILLPISGLAGIVPNSPVNFENFAISSSGSDQVSRKRSCHQRESDRASVGTLDD
jgi:hypothetical protein